MFRVVVNVADGTLADGSPAHPDDLARFEPWRAKFINTGVRIKRCMFHISVYMCMLGRSSNMNAFCSPLDCELRAREAL